MSSRSGRDGVEGGKKNPAKSGEKKKQWRHRRNDAKPLCNTPWTFNWWKCLLETALKLLFILFLFFFVVKNLMALEGRRRRVERGRGKFFGTAIARCLNVGLKIAVKIPRHFLIGQRHLADCTGCALVLFHSSGTAPGIAGCLSEIAVAPRLEPLWNRSETDLKPLADLKSPWCYPAVWNCIAIALNSASNGSKI